MVLHVDSLAELAGKGTFKKKSLKDFNDFLYSTWSGQPSEYCWNDVSSYLSPKTLKVAERRTFCFKHYLCLRPFKDNYMNPTDAFLYKVTNAAGRPKTVRRYYDYLFGEDSPWKDTLSCFAFVGELTDGVPKGIIWYDTGGSCAKLAVNLITAVRLHTCWGLDYVWARFVDAGFDDETALLLATNFSWNNQEITYANGSEYKYAENPLKGATLSKLGCSKTDMPFSTNYNPSGFKPFLDRDPKYKGKSLQEKTPIQPNNFIWHEDGVEVSADGLCKGSSEFQKSKIKVNSELNYLERVIEGKSISQDLVKEIQHKLYTNKMLEV
jgi:hypothetical protein